MVLTLVGLGLNDERDVTIRGLEEIRAADIVYLENYTATLNVDASRLERFFEKPIVLADRDFVEGKAEAMLEAATSKRVVCLVVVGYACRRAIVCCFERVVHFCLKLYRFGETVSIPFFDGGWKPVSFYEKIKKNRANNMHTLCLLDIKVKEQTVENMMKGNDIFEPPRFMTVNVAIEQLLEAAEMENDEGALNILAFGLARVGADDQAIVSGTLEELRNADLGGPLHSLVLCAPELHEIEQNFVALHRLTQ
ncbi:diphthine synthase, putative [Eimeria mitis]|uniref:Diphthine synthase, putative n=1 Tax=Eimeria mitis TaxID=44415 RepID=U6K870_9EIME|nr:diphthine synthase, putative [Eimeria mitis]CDJ34159.1 diphthine synthase, putative [Eimeria mitis]